MIRLAAPKLAPLVRTPAAWLRLVLHRLSNRGDTEHEQALVRIVIIGLVLIYSLFGSVPHPPPQWRLPTIEQLSQFFLVVSLLHFAWIVYDPAVNNPRRSAFLLVDNTALVSAMASGGAGTALLYPLLLWVTLGHGFRYGPKHLIGSALLSTVMFGALVFWHPYWASLGLFSTGLLLGLVLIPGYCYRLLTVLHDARERAEASSRSKSRFLATVSHELRTPLHAILGMTELLRSSPLRPEQRDMARTIHLSGHSLLNMIEDILDIARIEAGADRIDRESMDLHRQLRLTREMLAQNAAEKSVDLRLEIDPRIPPMMVAPRRALHQILVNLVANAVKFTDSGYVAIRAERPDDGSETVRLVVEDTGCGIPAAAQQRVFESFAQAEETTNRRYGGSGLGLAIVKSLVESARGSIELESEVGRGSRFTVVLPVSAEVDPALPADGRIALHGQPDDAQAARLEALGLPLIDGATPAGVPSGDIVDVWFTDALAEMPPHRHGRDIIAIGDTAPSASVLARLPAALDQLELTRAVRSALVGAVDDTLDRAVARVQVGERSLDVLVADDNRVNRHVIERLLARSGHRAVVVAGGEVALAKLREQSFDVMVLDLNMPDLGGLEVAKRLQSDPDRPRLIALTADATPAAREACEAAGFDAFLSKPVDGARLLTVMSATATAKSATAARAEANDDAPAPVATPERKVVDLRRIRLLRDLDQDDQFLAELIDTFLADGELLVDEIERAAIDGDVDMLNDRAHALRSAATHLGTTELFDACVALKTLNAPALKIQAGAIAGDIREAFEAARLALLEIRAAEVRPPQELRLDAPG